MSVLVSATVFAQADVDSPYSLYAVGQVRNKTMNIALKGMGSASNAMYGGGMINVANPASYAMIDSLAFLFDAGFYFKTSTFSTSTLSEQSANASFDYLAMCFGITQWWKTSLGVMPYSMKGYTMIVNGIGDEAGSATSFKGEGGLNRVFWGNGFKIGKHFSLGFNAYYVFGDTKTETTLYFPDSLYMLDTRRNVDLMVSSFMFDYGLQYNTDIASDLNLSVGLTYGQPIKLNGKQTLYIRSIEEDETTEVEYVIDTIVNKSSKSKLTMPQSIGVGVALQKRERWSIAADFNWTQWTKYARDGISDPTLQNSWNVAIGAEFSPVHSSISGYFRRMQYRVGALYEHGYLNINDHSIDRIGLTVGAALPLPRSLSKVNLALEVGQYGTKAADLIQERYIRLNVGISVNERWFIKRKYK